MKYRESTILRCSAVILVLACPAIGQTPEEHAKHHPAPGGTGPASAGQAVSGGMPMPGSVSPTTATSGGMNPTPASGAMSGNQPASAGGGGMGAAMGEMMKQMGVPPRKEVYPSLMALPNEVTPEDRAGIEQLANERMKAGVAQLSSGLERLSHSTSGEDYASMQQAATQMRAGLAEFEAGIAARRVLSEGKAPRNLALDWFKREMNLASPVRPDEPRPFLGVTPYHLFTMALLIAFAFAMVAMYFFKMRRAATLFGRVDPDSPPPPAGGPAPSSPGEPPSEKSPSQEPPPVASRAGTPDLAFSPPEGSSAVPAPGGEAAGKPPGGPAGSPVPSAPSPTAPVASDSRVAGRAGELWQARGRPMGSPEVDWARAQAELADVSGGPQILPASRASGTTLPAVSDVPAPAPVSANWRGPLRVGSIITETPGVKTYRLRPSSNDPFLPFTFVPGQFLNAAFWIGGAKMNRSYSISSSPSHREYVDLTVRREPRGAVSRHIVDLLKVNDQVELGGPVGRFTFTGAEAESIVLISAGVGITPMMSVTRYLTERSWPGDIFFLYTCHAPADFIFADEIIALERQNPKLHVAVTISKAEGTNWKGRRGRITKDWLTQTVPDLTSRRIHLCGPPSMMDSTKAMLAELGVPPNSLKTEAFGATKPAPAAAGTAIRPTAPATGPLVTFSKNNKSAKIHIDQTILELSEELAIGIEFSCRVGTCGICKVKMTSGEVEMEVQDSLDQDDKTNGIILACQAKPKGEVAVEA